MDLSRIVAAEEPLRETGNLRRALAPTVAGVVRTRLAPLLVAGLCLTLAVLLASGFRATASGLAVLVLILVSGLFAAGLVWRLKERAELEVIEGLGNIELSERRGADLELAQRRADLVSSVAHELKTPIAAIRAAAETLLSGRVTTPGASREYAQLVVDQSLRLTRLVDNMLAYTRITDVGEVYTFEPLAVSEVVAGTLRDFRSQLESAGFETLVEIPSDLPMVRADMTAMGLMLSNLVDNAVRYSRDRRWLGFRAFEGNGLVTIEVADRGIGIADHEIGKVTSRYFRGTELASPGSGLGLAIARRIAEDHGGSLTLRSGSKNGTTVIVLLPVWRTDEAAHPGR
jgi:signal transduction histidine kinase